MNENHVIKAFVYERGNQSSTKQSLQISTESGQNYLFFKLSEQNLDKNTWYVLDIKFVKKVVLKVSVDVAVNGVAELFTTSSDQDYYIVYDQNYAFSLFYINPISSINSLSVSGTVSQGQFGTIQKKQITITPGNFNYLSAIQGIVFVIESAENDFVFSSICDLDSGTVSENFCLLREGYPNQVLFYYPGSSSLQAFTLNLYVKYPEYPVTSDLYVNVYAYNGDNKPVHQIIKQGIISSYFDTQMPELEILNARALYGIEMGQKIAETGINYPILYTNTGENQVYNTLKFPFQLDIDYNLYDNTKYLQITIDTQHTSSAANTFIVPLSINHNMGSFQQTSCEIQNNSQIVCKNIMNLKANTEYFISAKISYQSSSADSSNFGAFQVDLVNKEDNQILKSNIFSTTAVPASNFNYIYSQPLSFSNNNWINYLGNTQVVSVPENSSQFTEEKTYRQIYSENSKGVGIFPERKEEQALIFFLDLQSSQVTSASSFGANEVLTLIINFNPNLIQISEDVLGTKGSGISISALNSNNYQSFGSSICEVNTPYSYCINYDDKENTDYENFIQIDNGAGYIKFQCGGDISYCSSIFDQSLYNEQIVILHGVSFSSEFKQNSILASDNQPDFLFSFFIENTDTQSFSLQSSFLVNGYTMSLNDRISNFNFSFVNYRFYDDLSTNNFEDYMDSYIRIQGVKSDFPKFSYLGVFFNNGIKLTSFENTNSQDYICSVECKAFDSNIQFNNVNYLFNDAVIIQESQFSLNQDFDILIAIQDAENEQINYSHIVLFNKYFEIEYVFVSPIEQLLDSEQPGQLGPLQFPGDLITYSIYGNTRDNNHIIKNLYSSDTYSQDVTDWKYSISVDETDGSQIYFKHDIDNASTSTSYDTNQFFGSSSSGFLISSRNINIFENLHNETLQFGFNQTQCIRVNRNVNRVYSIFCPTKNFEQIIVDGSNAITDNDSIFQAGNSIFDIIVSNKNYLRLELDTAEIFRYGLSSIYGISEGFHSSAKTITGYSLEPCYQYSDSFFTKIPKQLSLQINFNENVPFYFSSTDISQGYQKMAIFVSEPAASISVTNLVSAKKTSIEPCYIYNYVSYFSCELDDLGSNTFKITVTATKSELIILRQFIVQIYIGDQILNASVSDDITLEISYALSIQNSSGNDIVYGQNIPSSAQSHSSILNSCTDFIINSSDLYFQPSIDSANSEISFDFPNFDTPSDFNITLTLEDSDSTYVDENDEFQFTLGFLTDTNINTLEQVFCVPYVDDQLSFNFKTFTQSSTSLFILKLKKSIESIKTFKLHCQGAKTTSTTGSSNNFQFEWIYGNNNSPSSTQISMSYSNSLTSPSTLQITNLVKQTNGIGANADYILMIDIEESVSSSSRFFVQFDAGINSYLESKDGSFTCFIDNVQAHCEKYLFRMIIIYFNKDVTISSSSQSISLKISGVTQPQNPSISPKYVFVGLSVSGEIDVSDISKGIDYLGYYVDPSPSFPTYQISILSAEIDGNYREQTNHKLVVYFPQNSLTGQNMYIDFLGQRNAFIQSPSCLVYQLEDSDKNDLTSGDCSMIAKNRLKIMLNSSVLTTNDSLGVYLVFQLNNMGYLNDMYMEEYQYLKYQKNRYNILFQDSSYNVQSVSTDCSDLSVIYYPQLDVSLIDFYWYQEGQQQLNQISIGYTQKNIYIKAKNQNKFVSSVIIGQNTTFNEDIVNYFTVDPEQFTTYISDSYGQSSIKANSLASSKPYILNFYKSLGSGYSETVPDLYVIVNQEKCTISTKYTQYQVIVSQGKSWPIELDFSNCKPSGNLIVRATISGVSATINSSSQTIYYTDSTDFNLVASYLVSSTSTGTGTMSFSLTGSSKNNYNSISSVTINVLSYSNIQTDLDSPSLTIDTSTQNVVNMNLDCQINTSNTVLYKAYFVYHLIKTNQNDILTKSEISNAINTYGTGQIYRDDPFWTVMDYQFTDGAASISQDLSFIKDSSDYIIYAFCENQLGNQSDLKVVTFSTLSNSEYLLKLDFTFNEILSNLQIKSIACSLTSILETERSQIKTNNFLYCDNYISGNYQTSTSISSRRRILQQKINNQIQQKQINKRKQKNQQKQQELRKLKVQQQKSSFEEQQIKMCSFYQNEDMIFEENFRNTLSCSGNYNNLYKNNQNQTIVEYQQKNNQKRKLDQEFDEAYDEGLSSSDSSETQYKYQFYIMPSHLLSSQIDTSNYLQILYDSNINSYILGNSSITIPSIQNLQLSQTGQASYPTISNMQIYVYNSTMSINLEVSQNGYVYIGLDYRKSQTSQSLPNLIGGFNGDQLPFMYFKKQQFINGVVQKIDFSQLGDNQIYYIYMAMSEDEPNSSLAAFNPEIFTFEFQIPKKYEIPDISGQYLSFNSQAFVFLLICLIFIQN
ncbi:hypothetical protein PPERSA_01779 [Pseudocohnilembus persalinus]|uniref:Uncharacterized protein n=1 Tax=Pseudocohnilembus persalinus TaxID=266149 RepID=A0A0V0R1C8_PSEPJ|nr:hypothetical protein PPERSA_01779 [Pseudocohnilembus persalinus]|eukprot:KRX08318.1 hypothetical protein PPERSA_01779 [Pseudocohnilembus persalinus]